MVSTVRSWGIAAFFRHQKNFNSEENREDALAKVPEVTRSAGK